MSNNLNEIFDLIKKNEIILPSFQREFVWDVLAQKSLIASVISNIPCTSSLLVNYKDPGSIKFLCKEIGSNLKQPYITPSSSNYSYLLDGQQRYSTLFYAFNNIYENLTLAQREIKLDSIFEQLKYRWFLDLKLINNDLFGYNSLKFDKLVADKYLPEEIIKIISSKKLNKTGKEFYSINKDRSDLISGCIKHSCVPLFWIIDFNYDVLKILKSIQKDNLNAHYDNKQFDKLKAIICDQNFTESKYSEYILILNDKNSTDKQQESANNIILEQIEKISNEWSEKFSDFIKDRIKNYNLNPIYLEDIEKAIVTYSHINTGGTSLTTLDLICATSKSTDLRKQISENLFNKFYFIDKGFKILEVELNERFEVFTNNNGIQNNFADFFIQVLNIIYFKNDNNPKTGKAYEINDLPTNFSKQKYSLEKLNDDFIKNNLNYAIEIVRKICYFLNIHCGQRKFKNITNKLLLLPLAIAFIYVKNHDDKFIKKLISFYWIKLFSGSYDSHQNEQSYKDCIDIINWLLNQDPKVKEGLITQLEYEVLKKLDFSDYSSTCTNKPNNSLENNLMSYLLSINKELHDFVSSQSVIDLNETIHHHHLIPLASASTIGFGTKEIRNKKHVLNVLMNITPISEKTNIEIGRFTLNEYGDRLSVSNIDDHHITSDWVKFKYDDKDSHSLNKLNELFKKRHDDISKSMRYILKSYLD